MPAPIPFDAPVTTATFPASFLLMRLAPQSGFPIWIDCRSVDGVTDSPSKSHSCSSDAVRATKDAASGSGDRLEAGVCTRFMTDSGSPPVCGRGSIVRGACAAPTATGRAPPPPEPGRASGTPDLRGSFFRSLRGLRMGLLYHRGLIVGTRPMA